jgi:hypothetical protein
MAKARQEKWIMVRLRRTTHRQLLDLERLWIDAYTRGNGPVPPDDRDGISIDRMVTELLRRDVEHRARASKSSARKKVAKPECDDAGNGEEMVTLHLTPPVETTPSD